MSRPDRTSLLRRAFTIGTFTSALLFATAATAFVRAQFASDVFVILYWNPSTLTFTEIHLRTNRNGLAFHTETTTASASEDPATLRAFVGQVGTISTHTTSPASPLSQHPFLWADHYRTTSTIGFNKNGLTNCYTVLLRHELPLILFALLPVLWIFNRIRRRRAPTGFPLDALPPQLT